MRRYYAQGSAPRSMGALSVVMISVLSSAVVTLGILYKNDSFELPFPIESRDNPLLNPQEKENIVEIREVPSLLGLPLLSALELLSSRDLHMVLKGRRPDDTAQEGIIIEQEPAESSELKVGAAVAVTVSNGPSKVAIPDIIGLPLHAAKKLVQDSGLKIGETSETGTSEPGTIETTIPPPGTKIVSNEAIKIVLTPSDTTPRVVDKEEDASKEVEVPNLKRMKMNAARKKLRVIGLKIGKVRWRYVETEEPFVILNQTPVAGAIVSKNTKIEIVASAQ